jgi:magnesium transporter
MSIAQVDSAEIAAALDRKAGNAPSPERGAQGVVAASVYANGVRVADIAIDRAGDWARKEGHVVWIGLWEPDAELLQRVREQFGLHPLAIEDAGQAHQRPKLEQYGDALFGETHIFIGKGYIVTVRHGASTSYTAVRQHWESCPGSLARGEDFILWAILDFIVDNYMPVLESIHDEVEEIEDRVLASPMTRADIERLYMLRRDLLRLRSAAAPLVDVCGRLSSAELPQIRTAMHPMFRDVTDHIRTVQEKVDSLREVLAFAFEASLLVGQSQETAVAKRLASWAAILAVPTAIAGIYGMNFKNMPELETPYGYPTVIAAIIVICGILYWRFRKNGWL